MAGFDIFLKLDGIDGESATKGHEKEIEVVSYDHSIDSTVPSGGGAGGGAGKTTFSGVRVTHAGQCVTTGTQSPLAFETLAKSSAGAALLEEVTLHFGKIHWEYRPIGPKGTGLPPIAGGWDVKANRKL